MDNWQPIETAPKDGTEVIVMCSYADTEHVHLAWYRSAEEWRESGHMVWDGDEADFVGWWFYSSSVSQVRLEESALPKFWRPYISPELSNG